MLVARLRRHRRRASISRDSAPFVCVLLCVLLSTAIAGSLSRLLLLLCRANLLIALPLKAPPPTTARSSCRRSRSVFPRELSRAQGPGGGFPRPLTHPYLLTCSSWRASGRGRGVGQRPYPQTLRRGAEKGDVKPKAKGHSGDSAD